MARSVIDLAQHLFRQLGARRQAVLHDGVIDILINPFFDRRRGFSYGMTGRGREAFCNFVHGRAVQNVDNRGRYLQQIGERVH